MREFKLECIYEGLSYIRVLIVSVLFDHFWKVTELARLSVGTSYMIIIWSTYPTIGRCSGN